MIWYCFQYFGRVRYESLFIMYAINWPRNETRSIRIIHWTIEAFFKRTTTTDGRKKTKKIHIPCITFVKYNNRINAFRGCVAAITLHFWLVCNYLSCVVDFNFHIIFQTFIEYTQNASEVTHSYATYNGLQLSGILN